MAKNEKTFRPSKLTIEDIKSGCVRLHGKNETETKICMIQEELRQGIDMIQKHKNAATFYGSARLKEDHPDYQKAKRLAYRIVDELKIAVLSGGAGGIMEAANRGACEAGGRSVGLTIKLPQEQKTNKYVTETVPFYFFFTRKVAMSYTAEACLFFPGGFGTLDELFEILTLRQTNKINNIPIILVGSDFWNPLQKFIDETIVEKYKTVDKRELEIYKIVDDEDEILKAIKESIKIDALNL
ncbi:MAG: TIGR00730 family Rossman fold protein [Patescibacteria group bacterium]|nr:TIGR00730 family Rossman fold protein [Patescibacteria group bacterium]